MPLDAEELAEVRALETAEREARKAGASPVLGDLVITRRARDWLPFWVLFLFAALTWRLGQPIVGAAIGAMTVLGFFVHRARRVAHLSIGADGSLVLPGHPEIDWSTLRSLVFQYRYPWAATRRERVHEGTLHVVFELHDGSTITLARGALWRVRPTRAPVAFSALDRWLEGRARAAGMSIERGSGDRATKGPKGWAARRRAPEAGV